MSKSKVIARLRESHEMQALLWMQVSQCDESLRCLDRVYYAFVYAPGYSRVRTDLKYALECARAQKKALFRVLEVLQVKEAELAIEARDCSSGSSADAGKEGGVA